MTIQISEAPKKFIIMYMIMVFFLYVFGALNWVKENLFLLTIFYIIVLLSVKTGYDYGYSLKIKRRPSIYLSKTHINLLLILSVINLYPTMMITFAEEHLTIDVIRYKIFLATQGLGDAYYERGMNILNVSIFKNFWLLFGFLYQAFAAFITYNCMLHFNALNLFQKSTTIFIVIVNVIAYIAVGTNKLIFDYLLIIVTCVLLNKNRGHKKNNLRISFFNKSTLVISFVIVGALFFFGSTYSSRMEERKDDSHITYNSIAKTRINQEQLFFPKALHEPVLGFESYLTQGLAHLDKALGMDFKWCYGLGASKYFTMLLGHLGISDEIIKNRTYEERMSKEENVKNGQFWYSFYVAYANDITFFFVPLLIFILAVILGHTYRKCLETDDLLCFPIFILLLICFFYLNANNQIFGKAQLFVFIPLFIANKFVCIKCKTLSL